MNISLADKVNSACSEYLLKKKMGSKAVLKCGFRYPITICRPDGSIQAEWDLFNLMPAAARVYMMTSSLAAAAQFSSFYIGAYGNARTPQDTDTSADLPGYGEITTFSEGSRVLWDKGNIQGTMYDSSASPAVLTATVANTVVRGVFMSTSVTFGSVSGVLMSAVLAPTPETIQPGSTLRIPASILLESA